MQNNNRMIATNIRQWVYVAVWGTIWWVVLSVGTLLWAAPAVRLLPIGGSTAAALGPLPLVNMAKIPSGNTAGVGNTATDFTLSFTLQPGIVLLAVVCCATQALLFIVLPVLFRYRSRTTMVHTKGK